MKSQKKQSFVQGILTLMVSQVIIKIFGFAYKLYLTNKDGFGDAGNAIYSSGFQIYALLLAISSVGVPNAVAKMISEKLSVGDERGAKKVFKVAFAVFSIVGFIGATLLFVNAKYIANNILEIPEAELTLTILAPSVFFVALICVFRGYFNGYENMRPMAVSQEIEQLSKTIFTIMIVEFICVFMQTNENTAVMAAGANFATTIATIASFVYLLILYLKKEKLDLKNNRKNNYTKTTTLNIIKNLIIIAMPMTLSAVLGSLNKNIDSITVVRNLKNFLPEVEAQAQYGILSGKVDTLVMFPLSFNTAFATALVPAISADKARGNIENIKRRFSFSMLITILIGLPCCVGMIVLAKPILELLFPNASSGEMILKISSISIIFITIEQTINGALQGLGKVTIPVIASSIGVFIKLCMNMILIKINPNDFILGGVAGATMGTIMCHFTSMIISGCFLKKELNIKIRVGKFIIKPIIASSMMGMAAFYSYKILSGILMNKLATILSILICIIIYALAMFLLKIFSKDEIYMIKTKKDTNKSAKS